jgi:hypothetical protein
MGLKPPLPSGDPWKPLDKKESRRRRKKKGGCMSPLDSQAAFAIVLLVVEI